MNVYLCIFILVLLGSILLWFIFRRTSIKKYYIEPSMIDVNFAYETNKILTNTDFHTRIARTFNKNKANIVIKLVPREDMAKSAQNIEYYPSGKRIFFSWTYGGLVPEISIDGNNWLYGVSESGLPLDKYRIYVIRHEFMHALGYDHVKCNDSTAKNKICPTMYQSTRGCPDGFKCGYNLIDSDFTSPFLSAF